ncbi:glycine receptor subunit alpha-2-like [Convolutriloba macropyga]|uniref:glycine receptor subunit alpha-2-like n=1 Tax=Convolutriloba macropyga TaxID=536237 RepID=UPI003F51CA64
MYPGQTTANFHFSDFDHAKDYSNVSTVYLKKKYVEHEYAIHMQRKFGIYLLTIYLPNSSLSMLAWINFWIDPKCTPERAGLTITLALAQIVLITGVEQNFPSVSDFKMVDVYLIVNFLFNLACLIETVLASVVSKKTLRTRNLKGTETNRPNYEHSSMIGLSTNHFHREETSSCKRKHKSAIYEEFRAAATGTKTLTDDEETTNPVDFWSRLGFPFAFFLWNIVFFALTMHFAK